MNIECAFASEILTQEELREITGRAHKDEKIAWLKTHGWKFEKNAAGQPIVGRFYARMKLAGIELTAPSFRVANPDWSKVK